MYKMKQATEDVQKAIELNPNDHESYLALGNIGMHNEDYKAAVEQFGCDRMATASPTRVLFLAPSVRFS